MYSWQTKCHHPPSERQVFNGIFKPDRVRAHGYSYIAGTYIHAFFTFNKDGNVKKWKNPPHPFLKSLQWLLYCVLFLGIFLFLFLFFRLFIFDFCFCLYKNKKIHFYFWGHLLFFSFLIYNKRMRSNITRKAGIKYMHIYEAWCNTPTKPRVVEYDLKF